MNLAKEIFIRNYFTTHFGGEEISSEPFARQASEVIFGLETVGFDLNRRLGLGDSNLEGAKPWESLLWPAFRLRRALLEPHDGALNLNLSPETIAPRSETKPPASRAVGGGDSQSFIPPTRWEVVPSPLIITPPIAAAVLFVIFGVLTFGACDGYVSLVWFGLTALSMAVVAGLFATYRILGLTVVFALLCIVVGLHSMPTGCSFVFQV